MTFPKRIRIALPLLLAILFSYSSLAHPPARDMADAAKQFLAALTPEQQAKATFEFKNDERFNWHFIPRERKGLPFKEMNSEQRHLALALLQSALSEKGYLKATNVMLTVEQVLRELENQSARRDPGRYCLTLFGNPAKSPWGWRMEGHHLSLNFTVGDDHLPAITPSFFGSNPAEVPHGPHKGLRNFAAEEDLGRQLVKSLDDEQRKTAVLGGDAPGDILTGASRKADRLQPLGIAAARLTKSQQELLWSLLKEYVHKYRSEIADAEWKKIQAAGVEQLHFAWAGALEPRQKHYYRIQGPAFLIEYDNTQNDANHVHTVWRDLENDFGGDLLRKHYEQVPHVN
jgi:hypothetical protein